MVLKKVVEEEGVKVVVDGGEGVEMVILVKGKSKGEVDNGGVEEVENGLKSEKKWLKEVLSFVI